MVCSLLRRQTNPATKQAGGRPSKTEDEETNNKNNNSSNGSSTGSNGSSSSIISSFAAIIGPKLVLFVAQFFIRWSLHFPLKLMMPRPHSFTTAGDSVGTENAVGIAPGSGWDGDWSQGLSHTPSQLLMPCAHPFTTAGDSGGTENAAGSAPGSRWGQCVDGKLSNFSHDNARSVVGVGNAGVGAGGIAYRCPRSVRPIRGEDGGWYANKLRFIEKKVDRLSGEMAELCNAVNLVAHQK